MMNSYMGIYITTGTTFIAVTNDEVATKSRDGVEFEQVNFELTSFDTPTLFYKAIGWFMNDYKLEAPVSIINFCLEDSICKKSLTQLAYIKLVLEQYNVNKITEIKLHNASFNSYRNNFNRAFLGYTAEQEYSAALAQMAHDEGKRNG